MRIFSGEKFILSAIQNPVVVQDLNSVIVCCNESYLARIDKTMPEVLGRKPEEILPPQEARAHAISSQYLLSAPDKFIQYQVNCHRSDVCDLGSTTVSKTIIESDGAGILGFISLHGIQKCPCSKGASELFHLTHQETCILKALCLGLPVKAIARSLGISAHTVTGHMKSIYLKMKVSSRAEAQYKALAILTTSYPR